MASRLLLYSASLPNQINAELLLQFAITLQGRIFPPLLAASGAMFCISLFWLAILKLHTRRSKQKLQGATPPDKSTLVLARAEQYRQCAILSLWVATGLGLASTLAIMQTSQGLEYATTEIFQLTSMRGHQDATLADKSSISSSTPQNILITAGKLHIILQWCTTALLVVLAFGMSAMHQNSNSDSQVQQPLPIGPDGPPMGLDGPPLLGPGGPPPMGLGGPPPMGPGGPPPGF